jgi:hypothetical protein
VGSGNEVFKTLEHVVDRLGETIKNCRKALFKPLPQSIEYDLDEKQYKPFALILLGWKRRESG